MQSDLMLSLIKNVGVLENRLSALEELIINPASPDDEFCRDETEESTEYGAHNHQFDYPMEASKVTEATTNQYRFIKQSMYKVYIAKPHMDDPNDPDAHTLMEVDMTREELDDWLSIVPSRSFGEYIYKLIPSLDEQL